MDIEKERRAELIGALGDGFQCFGEVPLQHALFQKRRVRADVLAVPLDPDFADYALAFEVKELRGADYATWSQCVRQASDYVYAKIEPVGPAAAFAGRRISGAFLFPTPNYDPENTRLPKSPYLRTGDDIMVTGIFHLALHLRVGRALWEPTRHGRRFVLAFGPNPVWQSDRGFKQQAIGLLKGTRTLGSQRIDVKTELDGWGRAASQPQKTTHASGIVQSESD